MLHTLTLSKAEDIKYLKCIQRRGTHVKGLHIKGCQVLMELLEPSRKLCDIFPCLRAITVKGEVFPDDFDQQKWISQVEELERLQYCGSFPRNNNLFPKTVECIYAAPFPCAIVESKKEYKHLKRLIAETYYIPKGFNSMGLPFQVNYANDNFPNGICPYSNCLLPIPYSDFDHQLQFTFLSDLQSRSLLTLDDFKAKFSINPCARDNVYCPRRNTGLSDILALPFEALDCKISSQESMCFSDIDDLTPLPSLLFCFSQHIKSLHLPKTTFQATQLFVAAYGEDFVEFFRWILKYFPDLEDIRIGNKVPKDMLPLPENAFLSLTRFASYYPQKPSFWTGLIKAAPNLSSIYGEVAQDSISQLQDLNIKLHSYDEYQDNKGYFMMKEFNYYF